VQIIIGQIWKFLKYDKKVIKADVHISTVSVGLIGAWHWIYRGKKSEVISDLKTGFILLPEEGAARGG
jgi:predicted RNase H-like nuclease